MDHKRNLLLAALAVVSYFLLLAWNADFPAQTTTPPAATQAATVSTQAAASTTAVDLPTAAADNKAAATTAAAEPVAAAPSFITVTTPIQQIKIDTLGGDIVALALPKYSVSLDTPTVGFPLLKSDSGGLFIAQSGLVGPNGIDASSKGRPHYSAAQSEYSTESGDLVVDLSATTDEGVQITKRFIFSATDYLIRQQFIINNGSSAEWHGNVFGQIKRDSGQDPSGKSGVRLSNFLGAALTSADEPYIKIKLEDIGTKKEVDTTGGWIAFSQHYFLAAWIPATEQNHYTVRNNEKGEHLMGYVGPEHVVAPGQNLVLESALWAGPKNQDRLEQIAKNLGLTIDYGKLWFVGYPIFQLLSWLYALSGNYGVAIILLTVIIRSLFYPIAAKQFASSAGMKRLQPKIEQLKAQYGDDNLKLQQAQLELWKKEGVSPLMGCLPALLQMPVFIGIYWVLNESVELRHATFALWYHDLSAIDTYFVLPLMLGAVNFVQQQMTPMPTSDPMQAKMMKFMPVIFTVFFLWMPAGLVLYYFVNSLLVIMQQSFFNLRQKQKAPKPAN